MSFEEPKAPIVRIRKKKAKKKTKDKEIVHLPVRASTQARYASLTGGQDPQSKSRECCRHMFAGCFKIPICRTICFRCILPSCYKDIESDEEAGKDEGYHSQNRGSSDVPASFTAPGTSSQGAAATPDNAVEMTEIKTEVVETVALIPPPRIINDYRKDPCSRQASSSSTDSKGNQKTTGEITYIEVESVPVVKDSKSLEENVNAAENIPDDDKMVDSAQEMERDEEKTEGGNETEARDEVVTNSDSPETNKKFVDIEHETQNTDTEECKVDLSEYVECDNKPEKQQYFNFDSMNMPKVELIKSKEHDYINDNQVNGVTKAVDYANLDAIDTDSNVGKNSKDNKEEFDFTASEEPHDYMNLSELEKKVSDTHTESVRTEISQLVKITKSQDVETTVREENGDNPIEALKKQCLEVLESEFSDKEVSDHEDSKENNTTDLKPDKDSKISANHGSDSTLKETAVEKLAVKDTVESDTEHETERTHLVHVEDGAKIVGKHSKKTKVDDNSSDEFDSDSNGKKVTDQTKLI